MSNKTDRCSVTGTVDAVISLKECFILPMQGCSTNLASILYSHLPLYFLLYSCPLECHLFFFCNQYSNGFSSSIFSMKDSPCVLCPSSSWLLLSVLYFGRYYNIILLMYIDLFFKNCFGATTVFRHWGNKR